MDLLEAGQSTVPMYPPVRTTHHRHGHCPSLHGWCALSVLYQHGLTRRLRAADERVAASGCRERLTLPLPPPRIQRRQSAAAPAPAETPFKEVAVTGASFARGLPVPAWADLAPLPPPRGAGGEIDVFEM